MANKYDDGIIGLWMVHKNLHRVAEVAQVEPLSVYRVLREYGAIEAIAGWEDGIVPPRKGGKKPKVAGAKLEERVRQDLYKRGVGWVLKSHMSRGAQDLIAFREHCPPCFVQCKLNGEIRPHERAALLELAAKAGGVPVLAMMDPDVGIVYFKVRMTDRLDEAYYP